MKVKDSFEQLAESAYKLKYSSQLQSEALQSLLDITDGEISNDYDNAIVLTNGRTIRLVTNAENNLFTIYTNSISSESFNVQYGPTSANADDVLTTIIAGIDMTLLDLIRDVNDAMSLNSALATICDDICVHNEISLSDAYSIVNGSFSSASETKVNLLANLTSLGSVITAQAMITFLKEMSDGVANATIINGAILVDASTRTMQSFVGTVIVGTIITGISMALVATGNLALSLIGILIGTLYGLYSGVKQQIESDSSFKINYSSNTQLFENPCIGLFNVETLSNGGGGLDTDFKGILYTSLPGLAVYQWDSCLNVFLTCDCHPGSIVARPSHGNYPITVEVHATNVDNAADCIHRVRFGNQSYYTYPDDSDNLEWEYPEDDVPNLFNRVDPIEDWEIALRLLTGVLHYASLVLHDPASEYNTLPLYVRVVYNQAKPNSLKAVTDAQTALYNLCTCAVAAYDLRGATGERLLGEWAFANLKHILDSLNYIQLVKDNDYIHLGTISGKYDANEWGYGIGKLGIEIGSVRTDGEGGREIAVAASVFGANVCKMQSAIKKYSGTYQTPYSVLPVTRAYQFPSYTQGAFDRTLKLGLVIAAAAGAITLSGHVLFSRATAKYKVVSQSREATLRRQYFNAPTDANFTKWYNGNFLYNCKAGILGWPKIDMIGDINGGSASIAPVLTAIAALQNTSSKVESNIDDVANTLTTLSNDMSTVKTDLTKLVDNEESTTDQLEKLTNVDETVKEIRRIIRSD